MHPDDDTGRIDPVELRKAMRRLNVSLNRAIIAQANLLTLQLEPMARNLEAIIEAFGSVQDDDEDADPA